MIEDGFGQRKWSTPRRQEGQKGALLDEPVGAAGEWGPDQVTTLTLAGREPAKALAGDRHGQKAQGTRPGQSHNAAIRDPGPLRGGGRRRRRCRRLGCSIRWSGWTVVVHVGMRGRPGDLNAATSATLGTGLRPPIAPHRPVVLLPTFAKTIWLKRSNPMDLLSKFWYIWLAKI